jgi:hypothetical protein
MLLKVPKYNYKCNVSSFKIVDKDTKQDSKTGSVVQKSIKEIRDEVRMEKEKLKNRLWSDNE